MSKSKLTFQLVLFISLSFTLFSCKTTQNKKEVKQHFSSTSKELMTWISENNDKVQKMPAKELGKYKRMEQKEIFLAMTPKNKQRVWVEHTEDILKLDWNKKEKKHLKKLHQYLKENKTLFDDKQSKKEKKEFDNFMKNWYQYATDELKWTRKTLYYISVSFDNVYKKKNSSELIPIDPKKRVK